MLSEVKAALQAEWETQKIVGFNESVVDGYTGFIFQNRYGDPLSPHSVNRAIDRPQNFAVITLEFFHFSHYIFSFHLPELVFVRTSADSESRPHLHKTTAPIDARAIIVGGGNIHCITQQIPGKNI